MLASPGDGWLDDPWQFSIAFGICALGLQGGMGENHESHDEYSDHFDRNPGDSFSGIAKCHGRCKFYLVPNLDAIKSRGLGAVVFDAMTHSFFTLSVGIGAMEFSEATRSGSIPFQVRRKILLFWIRLLH